MPKVYRYTDNLEQDVLNVLLRESEVLACIIAIVRMYRASDEDGLTFDAMTMAITFTGDVIEEALATLERRGIMKPHQPPAVWHLHPKM